MVCDQMKKKFISNTLTDMEEMENRKKQSANILGLDIPPLIMHFLQQLLE